ncbi:MAG: uracil-DNA glycosylase [Polyangiaceae bacterium]|nr:uracil-DNA glycosylase [Polyangiaceae bacterium]
MNGGAGEGGEGVEASAREELRFLISAARAWLELHREAGSFGLPSGGESPDALVDSEGDAPRPLASVVPFSPRDYGHAPGAESFGPAPSDVAPGDASFSAGGGHAAFVPPEPGAYTPRPGAYTPRPGAVSAPSSGASTPRPGAVGAPAAGFTPNPGAVGSPAGGFTPEPNAVDAAGEAPSPPLPGAQPHPPHSSSAAGPAPGELQAALFSIGVGSTPLRAGVALGVETPADPQARLVRLQTLAAEAEGCTRCRLHTGRTKSVFARGNPRARIMFIGEGPGADEDAQGLPFVGKAGQLLDRMVAAMGLQQDEIYIANVVKCRPPQNRKPEPDEMSSCVPYLAEQIALIEPEVLIALGGTAAEGILGGRIAITRARGQWRLYRATIPVMPTYHPAYLLRNPPAKREVWADLQAVLQRLGRSVPGKGS